MRKGRKVILVALTFFMLMLTACGGGAAEEPVASDGEFNPADHTIYYVNWLKGHPVIRLMTLGFLDGVEELGYDYKMILFDDVEVADLVAGFEQAAVEGASAVSGFIPDPGVGPAVAALGEAGIPFISHHFPASAEEYPGLSGWIAADVEQYAIDVAMAMGEELERRGIEEGKIAITQATFNTVENLVAETFTATMQAEFPAYEILDPQEEGGDLTAAIAKASAILTANPDIVGALSTTGNGPTTWSSAVSDTGFADGEIVIISMDYTRPNLDLVKEGKVYALVGQPLYEEFYEGVFLLDKLLRGEEIEFENAYRAPIITVDDLDTYYALNDDVESKLGE
jgi:ribose transport system substrate-binding protein